MHVNYNTHYSSHICKNTTINFSGIVSYFNENKLLLMCIYDYFLKHTFTGVTNFKLTRIYSLCYFTEILTLISIC